MQHLIHTPFDGCATSWGQYQWLEGTLYSAESGEPLQGVKVDVFREIEWLQTAKTDTKGYYKILLDPGDYTVMLSLIDHNHITCHNVTIWGNEATVFSEPLTIRKEICGAYTLSFKETIYRPNNLTSNIHFSAERIRNIY